MAARAGLITLELRHESDVVLARQRVRDVADVLGLTPQDQTRVATAVSEMCRNAWTYGKGGRLELLLEGEPPSELVARISDKGPGISDLERILSGRYQSRTGMGLGIIGSRRLMDRFDIETSPAGTTITLAKTLPPSVSQHSSQRWISEISRELSVRRPKDPSLDVREQNRELLVALEQLRAREQELEEANRQLAQANQELEDTNRGVVALYAELDARAEFARKASELKTRFMSHLSHEFRTPLGSVLSLTDMLLARLDGPLTGEQETQIRLIRKSTSALSELVEDLLDIARVESGKTAVRPSEFTVAELFNALRGMVRPLLTNPNVQLLFEAEPLPALYTDEGKVSQVLRNLVSNALKFTERGEIRVRAEAGPDDTVVIHVSDTGLGIAPKDQERVFEEFVQVENRLQKRHKGTGLGLPLSRKLAELLGGSLTLTSVEGKGSTFHLAVKRRLAAETIGTLTSEVSLPSGEGRRVLVVEDHDASRYLMSTQLRAAGYEVDEVRAGEEAVQHCREVVPDIVVLDLGLPDVSGFDVLSRLKADEATQTVPVIIFTSSELSDDVRARLTGAVAIVAKPEAPKSAHSVDLGEALLRARFALRREGPRA